MERPIGPATTNRPHEMHCSFSGDIISIFLELLLRALSTRCDCLVWRLVLVAGMICKQRLKFGMRERVQVGAQVGGRVSVLFECYVIDFWKKIGTPDT